MESEERMVARLRAAEDALNEAIRDVSRAGLIVEVSTIEVSTMIDRQAQPLVSLRIIREL